MGQSVPGAWDALYAALQGLFADNEHALVSPGDPGDYTADLIVAVMGVKAPVTQPTAGRTRSRDKRITIDVVVSQYVAGGDEAQQPANQQAWAAAELIEEHFRVSPNETLGGACYNAFVDNMELTPAVSWQQVEGVATPVPTGRTADVDVSVAVWIRI